MSDPRRKMDVLYEDILGDVKLLMDRVEAASESFAEHNQSLRANVDSAGEAISLANQKALASSIEALAARITPIAGQIESASSKALTDAVERASTAASEIAGAAISKIKAESDATQKTAAKLLEEVAEEKRNVHASRWATLAGSVCIAIFCLGFAFGHWMSSTSTESQAVKNGQLLVGAEGQAAMRLAELGEARNLLNCVQPGWTKKDGYCYGTPGSQTTLGWRIR